VRVRFHLVSKPRFKYFRFLSRHLEFPNFGYSGNIHIGATEFLIPENLGGAFAISFLSRPETEIYVFQVYRPPSVISDLRLHQTISDMASLSSWAPNTCIEHLRSRFYLIWEPWYKYFRFGGRHIALPTSGYIGRHQMWRIWVPELRITGSSLWDHVSISSRSRDISTSSLAAAIF
jgi:hypothetical protein